MSSTLHCPKVIRAVTRMALLSNPRCVLINL